MSLDYDPTVLSKRSTLGSNDLLGYGDPVRAPFHLLGRQLVAGGGVRLDAGARQLETATPHARLLCQSSIIPPTRPDDGRIAYGTLPLSARCAVSH